MNITWSHVSEGCRNVVEKARIVPILQQILVITVIYDTVMTIYYVAQKESEKGWKESHNTTVILDFILQRERLLLQAKNSKKQKNFVKKTNENLTKLRKKLLEDNSELAGEIQEMIISLQDIKTASQDKIDEADRKYQISKDIERYWSEKLDEKQKWIDYHGLHALRALQSAFLLPIPAFFVRLSNKDDSESKLEKRNPLRTVFDKNVPYDWKTPHLGSCAAYKWAWSKGGKKRVKLIPAKVPLPK